jgi:hypothetical protein
VWFLRICFIPSLLYIRIEGLGGLFMVLEIQDQIYFGLGYVCLGGILHIYLDLWDNEDMT